MEKEIINEAYAIAQSMKGGSEKTYSKGGGVRKPKMTAGY